MAKRREKHEVVESQRGQGYVVERAFDDSLLPDASEIEKLYKLDNHILEWLKNTAEKEQNFRHQAFQKKLEIVEKEERGSRQISKMGITFSFIIVLAGMAFSAFLIYIGQIVVGTVFAGGIIISIVTAFLKKVKE